jgi:hypothetical protein
MTVILPTLSSGLLSTLELRNDPATVEFWTALSACTAHHALILKNLTISGSVFPAFWGATFRVESFFLHNTVVNADDSNHTSQL